MSTKTYQNLAEFYPFYLSQHLHPVSRYLHVFGTSLALIIAIVFIIKGHYLLIPLGFIIAYTFAWTGHYVFEKNRPATFKYPFMSFACDFIMLKDFFAGTLDGKIAQINSKK